MHVPVHFVEVYGVPPLATGWGWSMVAYLCLLLSLSIMLALLLWFLLRELRLYGHRH